MAERRQGSGRERSGRKTITLDLRAENYETLAEMARAQDMPISTMARVLLLPALKGAGE